MAVGRQGNMADKSTVKSMGEVIKTRWLSPRRKRFWAIVAILFYTLLDRHGKQTVTIRLPGDATLKWAGSLTLAPLNSEGELELENLQLDMMIAYLEGVLPLKSIAINLSSRFHYRIHM